MHIQIERLIYQRKCTIYIILKILVDLSHAGINDAAYQKATSTEDSSTCKNQYKIMSNNYFASTSCRLQKFSTKQTGKTIIENVNTCNI